MRGRSILSPIDGHVFDQPIATLRQLLKPPSIEEDSSSGQAGFSRGCPQILSNYQIVWDKTLGGTFRRGLDGTGAHRFSSDAVAPRRHAPRVVPDPERPWASDDDLEFRDNVVQALFDTSADGSPAVERLAPPGPTAPEIPFTMLRAGAFQLDELWLVDDFGQWADLLQGTSAGGPAGQVFHPRVRWHDDRFVVSQPPRVLQPVRLNFRFTPGMGHRRR